MDARTAASLLRLHGFTTEFHPINLVAEHSAHFEAVRVSGWFRVRLILPVEQHLRSELLIGVLDRKRTNGPATERASVFNSGRVASAYRSALLFLNVVESDWI